MLAKTKTYKPTDKEPFMSERQRDYFRLKLLTWREDILKEAKETLLTVNGRNAAIEAGVILGDCLHEWTCHS